MNSTGNHDLRKNETVWNYLVNNRGLQRQPLEVAIPLTVINSIIFVTGILGNVAVCIVIAKSSSLHTTTNYYLFNLAVSDLTLLIFGLPNDVAYYWHQYPWTLGEGICKIRALFSEMSSYVSVLTIVAFSTERYIAICYPFDRHSNFCASGPKRALKVIPFLWIISFLSALPFAVYTEVTYLEFPNNSGNILMESAFCGMVQHPPLPITELSTVIFFIIPLIVITAQYSIMAFQISRDLNRLLHNGSVYRGSRRRKVQHNKNVVKMLTAVVVGFFLCWAPFHAQRLLWMIYGSSENEMYDMYVEINSWMFYITGIFYYFTSTLNPILYNVMSEKMRSAFKEFICGIRRHSISGRSSILRESYHSDHPRLHRTSTSTLKTNSVLFVEDEHILIKKKTIIKMHNISDQSNYGKEYK